MFYRAARGALRYYDGDVVVLDEGGGMESEGVEICTFASGDAFYMVYSPVEPLLLAARQVRSSVSWVGVITPELGAGTADSPRASFEFQTRFFAVLETVLHNLSSGPLE